MPLRNAISIESSSARVADAYAGLNASVLVVEDDPDARSAVAEHLTQSGFDVTVAADGMTAMRLVYERRQHVICLDLNLQNISGFDVCEQIRADPELRDMGVVMVSAQRSINVEAFCLEAGADAFVRKPFDLDELARLVAQIAAGKIE